jgi:hypothetical protein
VDPCIIDKTEVLHEEEEQKKESSVQEENTEPKTKSRKWIWWLLIILLAAGLSLLLFRNNPSSSTDDLSEPTGMHEGYGYVDLGLSVKWATCNVGASVPGDYGNYYAWGETWTKPEYLNCTSYGKSWGDIGGDSSRDAATANWGGSWRMPTEAEFQELINNCDWTWTTQNGKNGYKVTSKKNGQSIFLPAAGYRDGASLYSDGERGFYWSSTPDESYTDGACPLYFLGGGRGVYWGYRSRGHSLRPVLED